MSEVKRYGHIGYLVNASDKLIQLYPDMTVYVKAADFDRVTAERDAALEEVEALKHWRDLALQFDNHRMKALWHLKTLVSDGAHYDAAAAFLTEPPILASEIQQLLTAADERADVLKGLLRDALLYLPSHGMGSVTFELNKRIIAALKPAKMLPADHKCIECESEYCHGVCVERGDSDDRLIG